MRLSEASTRYRFNPQWLDKTPEVGEFLEQLHALGVREQTVVIERDVWALMQSVIQRHRSGALWRNHRRACHNFLRRDITGV